MAGGCDEVVCGVWVCSELGPSKIIILRRQQQQRIAEQQPGCDVVCQQGRIFSQYQEYHIHPSLKCYVLLQWRQKLKYNYKFFDMVKSLFFFYPPIKYPPLPGVEWSGETDRYSDR